MRKLASEPETRAFVTERADLRVIVHDDDRPVFLVMEYQGGGEWLAIAEADAAATPAILKAYDGVTWSFGVYPQSAALPGSLPNLPEELAFSFEREADELTVVS